MELDKDRLLELYPEYTSVLGPYNRPDGRKHVVLNNANVPTGTKGKTRTISYPKAIVESNIGEKLLPEETIDHRNRNVGNNDFENLMIKERRFHASEDAVRVHVSEVCCVGCGKMFVPSIEQIKTRSESKPGPFCSRSCASSNNSKIRKGNGITGRGEIKKTYYQSNK